MSEEKKICWTITDGHPGMISQAVGLAEAIGLPTKTKVCKRQRPWVWLPRALFPEYATHQLTTNSDPLEPPWPNLLITCGRRSVPFSLSIKKQSQGKTFCVHIQNPLINPTYFDLVVAPEHDHLKGPNVISTKGALHKVTPLKLQRAVQEYSPLFKHLPRPYLTILIGGTTNRYKMTLDAMQQLISSIKSIHQLTKGSLLITPSFRTPFRDILERELSSLDRVFMANPEQHNPYLGMLGLANTLFVTNDSVNMVCEACATQKPVYILPLYGHGTTKPTQFIQTLIKQGTVRNFKNSIDSWTYPFFNDTEKIAKIVQQKMSMRLL